MQKAHLQSGDNASSSSTMLKAWKGNSWRKDVKANHATKYVAKMRDRHPKRNGVNSGVSKI